MMDDHVLVLKASVYDYDCFCFWDTRPSTYPPLAQPIYKAWHGCNHGFGVQLQRHLSSVKEREFERISINTMLPKNQAQKSQVSKKSW